jgi:hypothetical protein
MSERALLLIRAINHGSIVLLVGRDPTNEQLIYIACDHRPFATFWQGWSAAGFPQPVTYDDESQTLRLE